VFRAVWQTGLVGSALFSMMTTAARAEDLVMPFTCSMVDGELRVLPSNDTTHPILGARTEQPFVACDGAEASGCRTIMVHRFNISCDGQRMPWSRVAGAARSSGIQLPPALPAGFAPLSPLSGRFVLPALARTSPYLSRVATEDLSPDSVAEAPETSPPSSHQAWDTSVTLDRVRATNASAALRVGGSIAVVLGLLLAASMVAAGRWRVPLFADAMDRETVNQSFERASRAVQSAMTRARRSYTSFKSSSASHQHHSASAHQGFSIARAHLTAVERIISALAPELLFRDVLAAELKGVAARLTDAERASIERPLSKTASTLRILMRDIDRIKRLAEAAGRSVTDRDAAAEETLPSTPHDAYRILGINQDASPVVVKKLVDALRMSWHPDHARDDVDRVHREARIKQINAAWDIIKPHRVAA
jgi:DnaJ domain